jgi:hypothetical protein
MDTTTNQSPQNSSAADLRAVCESLSQASAITVSITVDGKTVNVLLTKYGMVDVLKKDVRPTLSRLMTPLLQSLALLASAEQIARFSSTNTGLADLTSKSPTPSASQPTELPNSETKP